MNDQSAQQGPAGSHLAPSSNRLTHAVVMHDAEQQAVGKRALAAEAAKALEAAAKEGRSKGEQAAKQVEEAIQRAMALQQGQEV